MRRTLLALAATTWLGCAAQTAPSTPPPSASSESRAIVPMPALGAHLGALGLDGVIALHTGGSGSVRCSDVARCTERSVPASTFKIVNAIVAIETGVAADATLVIPWDGVQRDFPGWNQDHTLRSAFDASSVPYFQELARRVGLDRMRASVTRLGYGNVQVGDVVDRFWLDGPLAVSPVEQVAFLARFEQGALPISSRTRDIVREVMVRARRGDAVLRGKTGWSAPGTADERGWFVGYATRGELATYVAVRATRGPGVDDETFLTGRMRAAIAALEADGAY